MQSSGWCAYKRRWTQVGEDELYFANVDGDPGRYARHKGKPVKELVSSCELLTAVDIRKNWVEINLNKKRADLNDYEMMKRSGRS